MWREIRQFWPSSKCSLNKIGEVGGATTNDMKAEILNDHFCTVGSKLLDNLPNIDDSFIPEEHAFPPVFELNLIESGDIVNAIKKLSHSKSSSLDGITAFMIKKCQSEISPVLTFLLI